ncbi:hypothetical protein EC900091_5962, partial [Escherichia coli 90.0091]
HLCYM